MEEQNNTFETIHENKPSALHQVTPLSKYLAMALFVILPFLGGYIGYTFAPEKVIEVERVVVKEIEVRPEFDNDDEVKFIDGVTVEDKNLSGWVLYQNDLIDLSFMHPEGWECSTSRTHADYPEWLQTVCLDKEKQPTNPVMVLDTPYRNGSSELLVTTQLNEVNVDERVFTKKHVHGARAEEYQIWDYIYESAEERNSFRVYFPFRTDEGTKKDDVEELSMSVVSSI